MIIRGVVKRLAANNCHKIAVSSIEHDSVLRTAKHLSLNEETELITINPDASGRITPEAIDDKVCSAGLLSVMYVNNETGVVNNIPWISEKYHSVPNGCFFAGIRLMHSDCVQAAGNYDIDVNRLGVDFATISSHKIHGPKGVGAIFAKQLSGLEPLIYGGFDQEFGTRGGTENVPGIVGFGKACEIALSKVEESQMHYMLLRDKFLEALCESVGTENVVVNGASSPIGKTLNIRIKGVDTQSLILMLDDIVCISAGSACSSHSTEPSHVLKAMGISDDDCMESLRISFSSFNSEEEVEQAANEIAKAANVIAGIDKH